MFRLDNIGVEIIPEGYGDYKSDVADTNAKTVKKGKRISSKTLTEQIDAPGLNTKNVHVDNDLAIEAFNRAKLIYDSLSLDERKETSHGYLATTIAQQLQTERNTIRANASSGRRAVPVKKTSRQKSAISLAPSTTVPAMKPKRKTVQTSKPSTALAESRHVVRKATVTKDRQANPFKSLGIKDLGPTPIPADVTIILTYTHRNIPMEHVFSGHWVMLKEDEHGQVLEADIVIDLRDETADTPPEIPLVDNATMQVAILFNDDEETVFEAIRGMFRVDFGVFQILKFIAAYNG